MSQQFCFKWNKHRNVMNEIKDFLLTEAMVDVTLACDGQSLKAHKIVLSAYSPLFKTLFKENPCKHPIVILKDMKYADLKSIIDFMYCGEINIIEGQLPTVIKTAQILGVKGLEKKDLQNRQFNAEAENRSDERSKRSTSVKFDFKRDNNISIIDEFKNFLLSEEMVDVTLICDGHSLKVHRLVLAAYSPFFMSLFLENAAEHPIIILKDMKYTELKSVIDYMYSSEMLDKNQLSDVVKAAQSLGVKELMEIDAQNYKSSNESTSLIDDQSRNPIGDRSDNQSSNEVQHQSVCAIDVSSWTLTEKQSLSNQNENENYVAEIKQEILSDDSDLIVPDTDMQIVSSSQSHDAKPFFQSEQSQPVEHNFDKNFALEDSCGGSSSNMIQQILSADNECSICCKLFLRKTALERHKRSHIVGIDSMACPKEKQRKLQKRSTIAKRKQWSEENMVKAIEAVRRKEMGYLRASKKFNVPKQTLCDKVRSDEVNAQKLATAKLGRKPVLAPELENALVKCILEKDVKMYNLTLKDVKKLAFVLCEKNGLDNPFNKKNKTAGRQWLQNFIQRHPEISFIKTEATFKASHDKI